MSDDTGAKAQVAGDAESRMPTGGRAPVEGKKSVLDYFAAFSSFSSAIVVAVIGGVFAVTQQHTIEANRERDATVAETAKEQDQRLLELQTVAQFMPYLTSKDEMKHQVAITAITALSKNGQLGIKLASLNPTPGAKAALAAIAANAQSNEERQSASTVLNQLKGKEVTQLGAAISVSSTNYGAALEEVEKVHEQVQDARTVAAFDNNTQFDPRSNTALLSDEDKAVRQHLLLSLRAYVDLLSAFANRASAAQLKEKLDQFRLAATNLPSLQHASNSSSATRNEIDVLSEALSRSSAGTLDIRRIVITANPWVQRVCPILSSDASVLQDQLDRDYQLLINEKVLYIRQNQEKLAPDARTSQIMEIPKMWREKTAADEKLQKARTSFTQMALFHQELAGEINRIPDPAKEVAHLVSKAERAEK